MKKTEQWVCSLWKPACSVGDISLPTFTYLAGDWPQTYVASHGETFKLISAPSDSRYESSYLGFIVGNGSSSPKKWKHQKTQQSYTNYKDSITASHRG